MTTEATFATARLLIKLGEGDELVGLFSQNRALFSGQEALLTQIVETLQTTGHVKLAADTLEELVTLAPHKPIVLQRLISLTSRDLEDQERTRKLLETHSERFPGRSDFRTRIEKTLT